jgi:hypothetical protein
VPLRKPTTNRKVDTQKPQTMAACGVERDNDGMGQEILISKNGWRRKIQNQQTLRLTTQHPSTARNQPFFTILTVKSEKSAEPTNAGVVRAKAGFLNPIFT